MNKGTKDLINEILILISLAIGIIIGMLIVGEPLTDRIEDLGQSICEQEYGMDYDYYRGGELYCKPAPVTEHYDGIKVVIGGKE